MHPSELGLKKESISTSEVLFDLVSHIYTFGDFLSNTYCASIGFEILKFARTNSDSNTFLKLSKKDTETG